MCTATSRLSLLCCEHHSPAPSALCFIVVGGELVGVTDRVPEIDRINCICFCVELVI